MPTSHHTHISDVITIVRELKPKSILDIGIGFGKWGFLFREYLDIMPDRYYKKTWKIKIDGVEIFEPYIQPHHKHIYDNIFIKDILEFEMSQYDLIFLSDVLEHISKEKAIHLIYRLREYCKSLLLIVPTGKGWLHSQGTKLSNKNEAHISEWKLEDLEPFKPIKIQKYKCGWKDISLFLITGNSVLENKRKLRQKNILFQYCNVWWRGGTTLVTLDIAKTFPHFHHVICYRHDRKVNKELQNKALEMGVELYHMPQVTEKYLKELNPFVSIFHCPGKGAFEDSYPHSWLMDYPTIMFHHAIIRPWVPSHFDIFNSNYTQHRYRNLHDRMKGFKIIPPCVDTDYYSNFALRFRKVSDKPRLGIILNTDVTKMSQEAIKIAGKLAKKNELSLRIIGNGKYENAETIPFSNDLRLAYSQMDLLIHFVNPKWRLIETWGRIITEALASGVYPIVSKTGGLPEQLESKVFGVQNQDLGWVVGNLEELEIILQKSIDNFSEIQKFEKQRMLQAEKLAGTGVWLSGLSAVIESVGLSSIGG